MTTGALIFAQNNKVVDYVKLAVFAASRVDQYLGIPVSLVTDDSIWLEKNYPDHKFSSVIQLEHATMAQSRRFNDGTIASNFVEWKNWTRSQVYDLTPYDRTLVLDSDYVLNSKVLKTALDNDHDFQIYRDSFDLALERDTRDFVRINPYSVPFYWATVFIFNKTALTESFFVLVEYIKNNWIYFRTLYNINAQTYRNDFAFSIAIHIMNGKTAGDFATELPGKMVYISDRDLLLDAKEDKMNFLVQKHKFYGEYTAVKTSGIDIHVMNKFSLSRYISGESGV
jgi:hypothetical protein